MFWHSYGTGRTVRTRPLGSTGVQVSAVCLGTATFGVAPDETETTRLVRRALDAGINFIDTASSYGNQPRFDRPGVPAANVRRAAEELVGAAVHGHRDDVVLATKVGEPVGLRSTDRGLSRVHITRQLDESLRRLRTDRVDILHAHHYDPDTPVEESIAAFDDLVRQGKILYWAISDHRGWQAAEVAFTARALHRSGPACHQLRYNLRDRSADADNVPLAARLGMTFTVFSPLAGGLLAGRAAAQRPLAGPLRFGHATGWSADDLHFAERVEATAQRYGHSSIEAAIGWLLAKPFVTSVIVGPETVDELAGIVEASEAVLDAELVDQLDGL